MSSRFLLLAAAWLLSSSVCPASPPAMKVLGSRSASGTNLLRNGSFEGSVEPGASGWTAATKGFALIPGEGRSGSQGLRCANTNASGWAGASQTLTLNRSRPMPLVIRGWSKAQEVSGSADSGYSLYVDILYADGTPLWGRTANFRCATHDWQQRELIIFPDKPVRSLTLHCILRGHSGTAWFDDVSVQELNSDAGPTVFDEVPVTIIPESKTTGSMRGPAPFFKTADGLALTLQGSTIAALKVDGSQFSSPVASGFLARDVAAGSDIYPFEHLECPELGLKLNYECRSQSNAICFSGTVSDLRRRDRAITLYFAVPFSGRDWMWGDDIRRARRIESISEFSKTAPVGCGATGTMALYPLAGIWNEKSGLGIGLDMAHASQFRLACNPVTQQLYLALDYGLAPETQHAGAQTFAFVLFRFDPAWGFRSALEKYTQIFPEHFRVRSTEQGIWMPFTDVSTVQGWEDFGFKYHEGINNVPWDDAHGILSFRYTEPMTWWMALSKDLPRTTQETLRVRDSLAQGSDQHLRRMAEVSKVAAMWDDANEPALSFRDTPWCNGAVWSLNPNPNLPVPEAALGGSNQFNAATIYWNGKIRDQLYGPAAKGHQDGEYLDSIEGYVTTDLNFRREHFRVTTVPLTFTTDTREPALFKGLAVYEFTRWLSKDIHSMDKLMFANGVPYRLSFLCPWLDVLGTETDWLRNGQYTPASDDQMSYWRTLSGRKPFLLLMNTDYDTFGPELVEKYFQRSLFYGMFPSMFSHNASDNPYWRNPKWYDRDRPLFKKYIPLAKKLAGAGWQPVTCALADNRDLFVERFGPTADRLVYFTLLNDTKAPQSGTLQIDLTGLKAKKIKDVRDLVSGISRGSGTKVSISLQPQEATVLQVQF